MPYGILIDSAAIARIAFYGVNDTVLDLLNDTHMIGFSVLCARRTFIVPIKENNHTGNRFGRSVNPLFSVFKPLCAVDAACKFRDIACVDIATLIGTPRNKASAPFQRYATEYIKAHPVAAVLLDMGLGKTSITLTALNNLLFDSFKIPRILIIAPLRVARNTWGAEIEK